MSAVADPEDEQYHSSSDSDFDQELSASSAEEESSENEAPQKKSKGRPKKRKVAVHEDVEMGSGDEGIIAQGRKRKKKTRKGKGDASAEQWDDGGDESENEAVGIRVRLRSGRGGETKSKKVEISASVATADIDSLWARMNAPVSAEKATEGSVTSALDKENQEPKTDSPSKSTVASEPEEMITIPHSYNFAGRKHITNRTVPKSSPEAQAYLASLQKPKNTRPLARKNLLEPNPSRLVNGVPCPTRSDLPPSIGGSMPKGRGLDGKTKDPKLNTVEKSKLDWQAEVERTGIREELDQAGKSSKDYLGRREFLDRVETGRDERDRAERLKGKG